MHNVLVSHCRKERVHPLVGMGLLLRLHCHHFISTFLVVDTMCQESQTNDIPRTYLRLVGLIPLLSYMMIGK
jgi:hypothetical protein